MKIGSALGWLVKLAAPVIGGLVAGPEAGGLIAAGLGAGAGAKRIGKEVEAYTGKPVHKVASPVAAVGLPALLVHFLDPGAVQALCEAVARLCGHPDLLMMLPGLIAILFHDAGQNIRKTAGRDARKPAAQAAIPRDPARN